MKCPICQTELAETEEEAESAMQCSHCAEAMNIPESRTCPICGDCSLEQRVFCIHCGYNFETGEMPECESVVVEVPAWESKAGNFLPDNLPGLFRRTTQLRFLGNFAATLLLAGAGFWLLRHGVTRGAWPAWLLAWMTYIQGVAFLCTGEVGSLRNACRDMTGGCWSCFLALSFLPAGAILLWLGLLT